VTTPSITEDLVESICALAEKALDDPAFAYDMRDELTPEVVRQLCNGWIAWVNRN
jgi:hypothetical protein